MRQWQRAPRAQARSGGPRQRGTTRGEHVSDEAGALSQMRARLGAGGRLVLTVPAHPKLWSSFDEASEHMRRYTPASLTQALRSAGFDIEYLSYFMCPLYPVMWLRRRLSLRRRLDFGAVSIPSSGSSPWSTRWRTRYCDARPSSFCAGGNCPSARPLP
ncbi:MAG: methyltransferase domain-containing protein [Candidatus Dormibacteria bacterium]